MARKYLRKKPFVFRAMQWTGKNFKTLRSFLGRSGSVLVGIADEVSISTAGEWVVARPGTWVVKDENGEIDFYGENFETLFEPI